MANNDRVVQTVLVQRTGPGSYNRTQATALVRELGHSVAKIDEAPHFWRFRQIDPSHIKSGSYRTFTLKPGVQLVYGELRRGVDPIEVSPRTNPSPAAWQALGPNAPYPCKTDLLGKHVPGVKGRTGTVTSCATPPPAAYVRTPDGFRLGTDAAHRAKRRGQVMLTHAGEGYPVPKEYASRKVRESKLGKDAWARGEHRHEIMGRIHQIDLDAPHVPMAVGLEYRHRVGSNRCAPDHPMWQSAEWLDILENARDRASRRADALGVPLEAGALEFRPNPDNMTSYEELLAEEVARDPRSRKYYEAERKCVTWFRDRNPTRSGGYMSPSAEAAERRRLARLEGVDLTSMDYLDTLSPESRARSLKKSKTRRTPAKRAR